MARPKKKGLEYFPMDVNFFSDIKCRRLLKRCGTDSIAVYIQLLTEIYKHGYWLTVDDDTAFLVSEQVRMEGEEDVKEIIKVCVEVGLFDADIYTREGVLTSHGIQERYQSICRQCGRVCNIDEYALIENVISSEETLVSSEETRINSEETLVSSEETRINSGESTQSKVKKSKYITERDISRPRAREVAEEKDWCEELKKNREFVEALAMQHGMTREAALALIGCFQKESAAKGIVHADYGDYRRHCYDWIRVHLLHGTGKRGSGGGKEAVTLRLPTAAERQAAEAEKAAAERRRVMGIYEDAQHGNARMKKIVAEWARNGVLARYGLKAIDTDENGSTN